MISLKSLGSRLRESVWLDLVGLPIECALRLSVFVADEARRDWYRRARFTATQPSADANHRR